MYGSDAAISHLTNGYIYLDGGNMLTCDPTDNYTDETNKAFIRRWNLQKQSKVIRMVGRLHVEIWNLPVHPLTGFRVQVRLTKGRREFYLMAKDEDSEVSFKFLDAQLLVKRVKPNPTFLVAQTKALQAGAIAKCDLSRVEVKTFTFASGSQLLSIDNAVLGTLPKRLLFIVVKNKDFLGSTDTNPLNFRYYNIRNSALYVNGKQIPSEGLHPDTGREKTTVIGYRTLFEASGICHSNTGL
jgi:hypothetical protein